MKAMRRYFISSISTRRRATDGGSGHNGTANTAAAAWVLGGGRRTRMGRAGPKELELGRLQKNSSEKPNQAIKAIGPKLKMGYKEIPFKFS
jgi:hypothetical protein